MSMHYCDFPQHASLLTELRAERALADRLAEALHRELDGFEDEEIGLQTHEAIASWRALRGESGS